MTDAPWNRCTCPPDITVVSRELRSWFGMFDAEAERAKANAQAAVHRRKYSNEQLPDEIAHDKRRKGNGNGRQSG